MLYKKEWKLSAPKITFFFIAFGIMTLLPGYPILMGTFFVCFGLFQAFQVYRESNDIVYSMLLPVSKEDIVKSKFAFCLSIEGIGFLLMLSCTLLRMTVLADSQVYRNNALMNANFVYLSFSLALFGLFNLVFIQGFFKTAYYYGKPFLRFSVVAFLLITIAESLHYIPGMERVNAFGFSNMGLQLTFFAAGAILFMLLTAAALKGSICRFEQIDL